MFTHTLTCILLLVGPAVAENIFLDCPGNKPTNFFQKIYRVCCDNEPELPKGCECFSIGVSSGFTNTKLVKPDCPEDINVRFLLYTRENSNTFDKIKASDTSIANSHFKNGKPIKFITHGFTDKAPNTWSVAMKDAILKKDDANVILVDWEDGAEIAGFTIYLTAAANVRTVGALIGKLLTVLVQDHGGAYEDVHLIGHSLGAHASGMAGKEVKRLTGKKIGRISGLDPAGPSFGEDYKDQVRLDKDDAIFVDVIHTDAEPLLKSGFGIEIDVGHVDFWPNGGVHQPSCPDEILNDGKKRELLTSGKRANGGDSELFGTCSHSVVKDYFISSITDCDYDVGSGCRMGYYADKELCKGRKDNINTQNSAPHCLKQ